MKKHPELWPHTPSDRYGTGVPNETRTIQCSQAKNPAVSSRASYPAARRTTLQKTANQLTSKKSNSPTKIQPQEKSRLSTGVFAERRASSHVTDKRLQPKTRSTNSVDRSLSIKPSGKRTQVPAVPPSDNVFSLPANDAAQHQVEIDPNRSPADSGFEIDSSLANSADGLKENDCQKKLDSRSNTTNDEMRLERARKELEELARREAEDRRQRQMIVENILSKFNSNQ